MLRFSLLSFWIICKADSPSQNIEHCPLCILLFLQRLCNSSSIPNTPNILLQYDDCMSGSPGDIDPAVT